MWTIPQSRQPELMDDPSLPAADHFCALDALSRINALSLTAAQIAAAVGRLLDSAGRRTDDPRPVEIVDVACGGGDVTAAVGRRIARRAGGFGRGPVHVTGLDVSPRALDHARRHARVAASPAVTDTVSPAVTDTVPPAVTDTVSFAVRDVVADGCPACDIAICSLFLHHLDDDAAVRVLTAMAAAARVGLIVSDLVRSRTGLVLARLGTLVLSGSRVARVDGPLSVRAARTPAEYRRLLDHAGLRSATVRRIWPERVLIAWARDPAEATA
jgi:SAM-dependent methyltransferase